MQGSVAFDKIKTLIAEGDKSALLIYKIGLIEEVFEKRFLTDGNDVLEVYREWKPDILLLDVTLPGKYGYSILKAIREKMQSADTAIIMAASLSDRGAFLDCLELGIQGYIVKPFTHEEVSQRVLSYYQAINPERAAAALALLDIVKTRAIEADTKASTTGKSNEVKD